MDYKPLHNWTLGMLQRTVAISWRWWLPPKNAHGNPQNEVTILRSNHFIPRWFQPFDMHVGYVKHAWHPISAFQKHQHFPSPKKIPGRSATARSKCKSLGVPWCWETPETPTLGQPTFFGPWSGPDAQLKWRGDSRGSPVFDSMVIDQFRRVLTDGIVEIKFQFALEHQHFRIFRFCPGRKVYCRWRCLFQLLLSADWVKLEAKEIRSRQVRQKYSNWLFCWALLLRTPERFNSKEHRKKKPGSGHCSGGTSAVSSVLFCQRQRAVCLRVRRAFPYGDAATRLGRVLPERVLDFGRKSWVQLDENQVLF